MKLTLFYFFWLACACFCDSKDISRHEKIFFFSFVRVSSSFRIFLVNVWLDESSHRSSTTSHTLVGWAGVRVIPPLLGVGFGWEKYIYFQFEEKLKQNIFYLRLLWAHLGRAAHVDCMEILCCAARHSRRANQWMCFRFFLENFCTIFQPNLQAFHKSHKIDDDVPGWIATIFCYRTKHSW